jgi:hypothetical protein
MDLKNKSSKIVIFIIVIIISLIISGIIRDEGGPIWLGAVFIFIAYKLIFKSNNSIKNNERLEKEIIKANSVKLENSNPQKGKIFQKKYLILIGLCLGVIMMLLAFGKYDNKTKSSIQQNTETNIIRIDTKSFLEETISKQDYTISQLEKELSSSSYDHSLLLNKAIRFKVFIEGQNYSSKLYGQNCGAISNSIGIENMRMQNTYSEGILNSKYLYDIAVSNEPDFSRQYSKIMEKQIKNIKDYLGFSSSECNQVLSVFQNRNRGVFNDDKTGNNILSFNYLTNPVDELFDNHYQEFSSYSNAPNEDFFLTVQLPKSWNIKEKKSYTNASTVAVIEPYEKYLNGIITISFYKKFVPEGVSENEYTDNDITEVFYEDDEILKPIIFSLNKELKETDKIKSTLYKIGGKTYILYLNESEITNGLASNQKIKSLNAISFHNGKLIKISFSGTISQSEFSSYPYYSKLFFKILNTIKYRELYENTIYLTSEQNMKFLTASIDGNNYKFLLDTGASNVVINKTVLSALLENGYLTRNNYIGNSMVEIADGSVVECENWKVPELKIGKNIIKDIVVSVINSEESMLLFGMDGLDKLNIKRLNLKENEITLNRE